MPYLDGRSGSIPVQPGSGHLRSVRSLGQGGSSTPRPSSSTSIIRGSAIGGFYTAIEVEDFIQSDGDGFSVSHDTHPGLLVRLTIDLVVHGKIALTVMPLEGEECMGARSGKGHTLDDTLNQGARESAHHSLKLAWRKLKAIDDELHKARDVLSAVSIVPVSHVGVD